MTRFLVAVSLGLAVATALSDTTADSARPTIVGVNVRADWALTEFERDRVFEKLSAARVGWVRLAACWCQIELQPGVFGGDYERKIRTNVDAAHAHGLRVLLILWGTPAWHGWRLSTPARPEVFASFAEYAAWAFEPDAWEVWNEPDYRLFWRGTPEQYGRLLAAAYPPLHATGKPVLFGGLAHNEPGWLRRAMRAGARFDAIAAHPYPSRHDATPERALRRLEPLHHVVPRASVWITELGWSTYPGGVTERQQAAFVIRTLRLLRERYAYVRRVFFYVERDDRGGGWLRNLGLLRHDLSEKPALRALRRVA